MKIIFEVAIAVNLLAFAIYAWLMGRAVWKYGPRVMAEKPYWKAPCIELLLAIGNFLRWDFRRLERRKMWILRQRSEVCALLSDLTSYEDEPTTLSGPSLPLPCETPDNEPASLRRGQTSQSTPQGEK